MVSLAKVGAEDTANTGPRVGEPLFWRVTKSMHTRVKIESPTEGGKCDAERNYGTRSIDPGGFSWS